MREWTTLCKTLAWDYDPPGWGHSQAKVDAILGAGMAEAKAKGWWGEHWPLVLFPALATGGSVVAAVRVDEWSKDFNWWLVIIGAAGLGLALGTAIWNAIITRSNARATDELAANQGRIADLTQEVATTRSGWPTLPGNSPPRRNQVPNVT